MELKTIIDFHVYNDSGDLMGKIIFYEPREQYLFEANNPYAFTSNEMDYITTELKRHNEKPD